MDMVIELGRREGLDVVIANDPDGDWAHVRGERWRVVGSAPLQPGDHVRVTAIDGLTLSVEKVSNLRS